MASVIPNSQIKTPKKNNQVFVIMRSVGRRTRRFVPTIHVHSVFNFDRWHSITHPPYHFSAMVTPYQMRSARCGVFQTMNFQQNSGDYWPRYWRPCHEVRMNYDSLFLGMGVNELTIAAHFFTHLFSVSYVCARHSSCSKGEICISNVLTTIAPSVRHPNENFRLGKPAAHSGCVRTARSREWCIQTLPAATMLRHGVSETIFFLAR